MFGFIRWESCYFFSEHLSSLSAFHFLVPSLPVPHTSLPASRTPHPQYYTSTISLTPLHPSSIPSLSYLPIRRTPLLLSYPPIVFQFYISRHWSAFVSFFYFCSSLYLFFSYPFFFARLFIGLHLSFCVLFSVFFLCVACFFFENVYKMTWQSCISNAIMVVWSPLFSFSLVCFCWVWSWDLRLRNEKWNGVFWFFEVLFGVLLSLRVILAWPDLT